MQNLYLKRCRIFHLKKQMEKKRVSKRQLAIKARYPNYGVSYIEEKQIYLHSNFIEEISEGITPLSILLDPTISAIDEDIVYIRNGLRGQFIWFLFFFSKLFFVKCKLCRLFVLQQYCNTLRPYQDPYERKRMDIPTPSHVLTRYQIILKILNDIKSSTL